MISRSSSFLLAVILLASPGFAASDMYRAAVNYPVGDTPLAVAALDVNGDGSNDVVTANSGSNTISILLNDGDGTLQAAVSHAVGIAPADVHADDFSNDGLYDLAIANSGSDNISIWLSNGDGSFQTAVDYAVEQAPVSISSADYNGDNYKDLAVVNSLSNSVSVLMNNGDGTFAPAVHYAIFDTPHPIVSADFNGDGYVDLVIAHVEAVNLVVLMNNGAGVFEPHPRSGSMALPWDIYGLAAADLDRDGDVDLLCAHSTGGFIWAYNDGTGFFNRTFYPGDGYQIYSMHSRDLNFDGSGDIIAGSKSENNVIVWLNDNDDFSDKSLRWEYPCGIDPADHDMADLDGDGDFDIVTANSGSDNVSVLLNSTFEHGCGDANSDWRLNIGDPVYLIGYIFREGPPPEPYCIGDANGDGELNVGDVVYLLAYTFSGGPEPTEDCCP
jgi:hypothetical protein